LNSPHDPPENPYAAPQAELGAAKPKVIYVKQFNGKLAFWATVLLGALILSIDLPENNKAPQTIGNDIFALSMIAATSISVGIYLGFMYGIPVPQQTKEPEQIHFDEPPC